METSYIDFLLEQTSSSFGMGDIIVILLMLVIGICGVYDIILKNKKPKNEN